MGAAPLGWRFPERARWRSIGGRGLNEELKNLIEDWLRERVDAFGMAPVERFEGAPDEHHPSLVCRDAATIIVYGVTVPRAVLTSPGYGLHLLQRSYHTAYPYLDQVGLQLANLIEAEGFSAVEIPSYAPMVFHGLEPWGIISLKHAAVLAGVAAFGRSGMAYHPRFGSLLRLDAVVTSANMEGDSMIEQEPCPPKCKACQEACPPGAFPDGEFQKMVCLGHAIKHGIYKLALNSAEDLQHIERIINTAGYNYWIDCDECLKACPLNKKA
jgi:epoxyqueuosine reductase